jgi:amino acid transporter
LLAALGAAARPQGMRGALQNLLGNAVGGALLWIVAVGLACFAGWRLLQAFFDADQLGSSLMGLTRRVGFAISGVFYMGLASATVQMTFAAHATNDNRATRDWTHWALTKPLGRILVAAAALCLVSVAIVLILKLIRAPYRRRLRAGLLTREAAVALGSFGILTRAIVFLMISAFLAFAAYDANSREALGLSGALHSLQEQPYGGVLLAFAGLGFIAFSGFEMIEAVARRVRTPRL